MKRSEITYLGKVIPPDKVKRSKTYHPNESECSLPGAKLREFEKGNLKQIIKNSKSLNQLIRDLKEHKDKVGEKEFKDYITSKNELYILVNKIITRTSENVKNILKLGFEVNAQNNQGNTPLHILLKIAEPRENTLTLLLEHGADTMLKNKDGKTPVNILEENSKLKQNLPQKYEKIKGILDNSKSLQEEASQNFEHSRNKLTPEKILIKLEEYSKNELNYRSNLDKYIEFIRAYKNIVSAETFNKFLKGEAPSSMIHHVTKRACNHAKDLLELGYDVNARNSKLNTPLHILLKMPEPRENTLKLLLDQGADITLKNKDGKTPEDILVKNSKLLSNIDKYNRIIKILDEAKLTQEVAYNMLAKLSDTGPKTSKVTEIIERSQDKSLEEIKITNTEHINQECEVNSPTIQELTEEEELQLAIDMSLQNNLQIDLTESNTLIGTDSSNFPDLA